MAPLRRVRNIDRSFSKLIAVSKGECSHPRKVDVFKEMGGRSVGLFVAIFSLSSVGGVVLNPAGPSAALLPCRAALRLRGGADTVSPAQKQVDALKAQLAAEGEKKVKQLTAEGEKKAKQLAAEGEKKAKEALKDAEKKAKAQAAEAEKKAKAKAAEIEKMAKKKAAEAKATAKEALGALSKKF